jgi:hypothetical protein
MVGRNRAAAGFLQGGRVERLDAEAHRPQAGSMERHQQ